jgi:deoxyribonuclease V
MRFAPLHGWEMDASAAVALQKRMAAEVIADRPLDLSAIRVVAGVDVSVKVDEHGIAQSRGAVVALRFPDLTAIETATASMPTPFPYIPGLLSFREMPVLLAAFETLTIEPDALIVDGMGRAHPRRFGIACHLGLWLDKPSIGCGKTLFVGRHDDPPDDRGAYADLVDRGEIIGAALRTRPRVKPVYISVGHRCDLASALALTMACVGRYRLPEPIRAAHNAAGARED